MELIATAIDKVRKNSSKLKQQAGK
jgi:hypothetical protein